MPWGNAKGGVRTPYVDVPTARWVGAKAGPFRCLFVGYKIDFDDAKLRSLYKNPDDYLTKVRASAARLERERWLTPADAAEIVREAQMRTPEGRIDRAPARESTRSCVQRSANHGGRCPTRASFVRRSRVGSPAAEDFADAIAADCGAQMKLFSRASNIACSSRGRNLAPPRAQGEPHDPADDSRRSRPDDSGSHRASAAGSATFRGQTSN